LELLLVIPFPRKVSTSNERFGDYAGNGLAAEARLWQSEARIATATRPETPAVTDASIFSFEL
jgi:hypothetical protein